MSSHWYLSFEHFVVINRPLSSQHSWQIQIEINTKLGICPDRHVPCSTVLFCFIQPALRSQVCFKLAISPISLCCWDSRSSSLWTSTFQATCSPGPQSIYFSHRCGQFQFSINQLFVAVCVKLVWLRTLGPSCRLNIHFSRIFPPFFVAGLWFSIILFTHTYHMVITNFFLVIVPVWHRQAESFDRPQTRTFAQLSRNSTIFPFPRFRESSGINRLQN